MGKTFADDILQGKNAYVAGGTRGMNLAIARRYAAYGANVAVMSRNPERCAAAQAELREFGVQALGIPCDARDYDAVEASMKQVADAWGGLDLVVAGQAGNFYAPITGMSANERANLGCDGPRADLLDPVGSSRRSSPPLCRCYPLRFPAPPCFLLRAALPHR